MTTGDESLRVVLRDGTHVLIRRIRPDDTERLVVGFESLSPRSRYLRFHGVVDHLTEEQVRFFTEIDHHDHVVWVALDDDAPHQPGVGVARYMRLADEPTVAEVALTVVDAYQGRGVGTALAAMLGRSAIENGIRTFRTYVLAENAVVLDLFQQLDARVAEERFGVVRIDYPLPHDPDELPDTPAGRAMRAVVGAGVSLSLGPPLWLEDHSDAPEAPPRSSHHERGSLRDWLDEFLDDPG